MIHFEYIFVFEINAHRIVWHVSVTTEALKVWNWRGKVFRSFAARGTTFFFFYKRATP